MKKLLHRLSVRLWLPFKWAKSQRLRSLAIVEPDENWGLWLIQKKEEIDKEVARWHRVGDQQKLAYQNGRIELLEELMNIKAYGTSSEQSGE